MSADTEAQAAEGTEVFISPSQGDPGSQYVADYDPCSSYFL